MNVSKYCRENGIPRSTYYYKPRHNPEREQLLKDLAETGIDSELYRQRIRAGWSETEARYTRKYQYKLPDGRLLIHAFDSRYKYQKAWHLINDEGMSIEEAYDYVISGKRKVRAQRETKYTVNGVPLSVFCHQNNVNYDTARRYINNEIDFIRRGKHVDSVVSALRGKKIRIGRWGRF